jgi:VanZ family protein
MQDLQKTMMWGWRAAFWLAVLVTTLVLLLPGDAVLDTKVWMASWLPYAQVLDQSNVSEYSDKWVHLGLFALLGALAARLWWGQGMFKTAALGLLTLAVGTECLQHFIPGRGASVADLLADVAGLALGSAMWLALQLRGGGMRSIRAVDFSDRD